MINLSLNNSEAEMNNINTKVLLIPDFSTDTRRSIAYLKVRL